MDQAIATFNPDVFSNIDDVTTVIKCLPTEEEAGLLDSYVSSGANLDLLPDEERFCIMLMKVRNCFTDAKTNLCLPFYRLQAMRSYICLWCKIARIKMREAGFTIIPILMEHPRWKSTYKLY